MCARKKRVLINNMLHTLQGQSVFPLNIELFQFAAVFVPSEAGAITDVCDA
jgi:hypothetical protein